MPVNCRPIATALALLLVVACNDSSSPPLASHFEMIQGPPDQASPGLFLLDTMRVRLVDEAGDPVPDKLVTWVVLQGGGDVIPIQNQTDEDGIAEARWSLGSAAGLNQIEVRTQEDSAFTFQTTGEAFRVDELDSDYGLGCGLVQGDVWCWGQYSWVESAPVSDQPSDVFDQNYNAPGLVLGGQQIVDLAVGWPGGCGRNAAGTVQCFASGTPAFTAFPAVPPMRKLTAGESAYCGIAAADSTAWCWNFMTGVGSQLSGSPALVELDVAIGSSGLAVYGCGRLVDSTVVCWGDGPRGNGSLTPSDTIAAVSGGKHFAELAVGRDFACGRLANGEVWCWGQNDEGQLGAAGLASAVPVLATTGVTRLTASQRTGMAIRNGSVIRWGSDQFGAPMGPVQSLAALPVADLAASDVSCVRLADDQVYCFDELWFIGSSFNVDRYSPVQPVAEP
jgi:hypothetical protein